jgi:hypothetical protein
MAHNDNADCFEWLPDGERHISCDSKPLSKEQAITKFGLDGWAEWMADKPTKAEQGVDPNA